MARTGGYRHLIYFVDGTWLWAGSAKNMDIYSNVYRLNMLLNADDKAGHAQIAYYSRGLGAGADKSHEYLAGAFAFGIDEQIADIYVNICSNYQRRDRIYIFGFSRGAVVARALTGLLSHGILRAHHINMFSSVWDEYANTGEVLPAGRRRPPPATVKMPDKDREIAYDDLFATRNPKIEFVGVFDTVCGGHGPMEVAQQLRLSSGAVQANVKHAVQLLSIDETRDFFKPVYWTGLGSGGERPLFRTRRTLEQIWLPGVHSDVGGAEVQRGLGNLALLTMIDRVISKTKLSFNLKEAKTYQVRTKGDRIFVSSEFVGMWKNWSGTPRKPDVVQQTIHPFAKRMLSLPVSYKTEREARTYTLSPELNNMKSAKEYLTGTFKSNF